MPPSGQGLRRECSLRLPLRERLSEAHEALDLLEPERIVRCDAEFIVNLGVRGEFGTSGTTTPLFSGRDKRCSDSRPAERLLDKPALQKSDVS